MPPIHIRLFGRPQVLFEEQEIDGLRKCRGRKLLYYLLLHRGKSLTRERLASVLFDGNGMTTNSMKSLRNALWELRSFMGEVGSADLNDIVIVSRDSIELRLGEACWLDVDAFENAAHRILNQSQEVPSSEDTDLAVETAAIYRGLLLPSCHDDWCDFERDRLHEMYLLLLTKIAWYYEETGALGTAISYCQQIIRYDHACERAHRQLMRLYFRLGDRTGAIRQYQACQNALKEEFGASPGALTTELFNQINEGSWN